MYFKRVQFIVLIYQLCLKKAVNLKNKTKQDKDFPGSPVSKTPLFTAGGEDSWLGDGRAAQPEQASKHPRLQSVSRAAAPSMLCLRDQAGYPG